MSKRLLVIAILIFGGLCFRQWGGRYASTADCQSNLADISDALQQFHREFAKFPPAWSEGDVRVSWRVALLPYLGEDQLYADYDADTEWDSVTNQPLLNRRPAAYACPEVTDATQTAYQGVIGFHTAWPYQNPMTLRDFHDGASNTLLLLDYHSPTIPWTSTNDVGWREVTSQVPTGLHHNDDGGTLLPVVMADGSVRSIAQQTDPEVWRTLLTPQTGKPIRGKTFSEDIESELAGAIVGSGHRFAAPMSPARLSATRMLPMLDESIKPGENMIYCPTFSLAWRQYSDLIPQKALTHFAKRVAAVPFSADDIDADDMFIVAGRTMTRQQVSDISQWFLQTDTVPSVLPTEIDGPRVYVALKKHLPFISEFERFENPLAFDAPEGSIRVRSFGVTSAWDRWSHAMGQIRVLVYRSPDDFIIRIGNLPGEDLILAKMPQPKSIATALERVDELIAATDIAGDAAGVVSGEQVVIPIIEFSLVEDFTKFLRHPDTVWYPQSSKFSFASTNAGQS